MAYLGTGNAWVLGSITNIYPITEGLHGSQCSMNTRLSTHIYIYKYVRLHEKVAKGPCKHPAGFRRLATIPFTLEKMECRWFMVWDLHL